MELQGRAIWLEHIDAYFIHIETPDRHFGRSARLDFGQERVDVAILEDGDEIVVRGTLHPDDDRAYFSVDRLEVNGRICLPLELTADDILEDTPDEDF